jgi:hypothetical protein
VIIRNLPGARASVGRTCRCPYPHNNTTANSHSCSNLFVAAPVVARLNLNGQMSLLIRTERSVSFPMSLPPLNNFRPHRTTSAIVSMPLLAGGRKKRMFIGIIANLIHHKKSVRKRSVKSRRQRQRHSPSRCMPSFSLLDIHSHTHIVVLGRQRKNHPRAHKARAQMRYP